MFAATPAPTLTAAPDPATLAAAARGAPLYTAHCAVCHQSSGLGIPGVIPPLALSDWLATHRHAAIRAVVAGLRGPITVNGLSYTGQMPAIALNDAQAADTLTHVLHSWGNPGGLVTPEEVRAVRATTEFPTFAALQAAGDFLPLPTAPAPFVVNEVARLPDFATRLASDGRGKILYVLGRDAAIWRLDLATGSLRQIIRPTDFYEKKPAEFTTLGLALDRENRLWITANVQRYDRPLVANEVTIFRTTAHDTDGAPIAPQPWFRTEYPYGMGTYNHGISALAFGPDGLLYVASGSRTDGGEAGNDPRLGRMGETDLTACIWRLDPAAPSPKITVVARGIRNAYSLAWDGAGHLFTVSNGPDAHAPEEMDCITPPLAGEPPSHHGFPYQYGNTPATHRWYPHTPTAPPGLKFVLPVTNLGPAGTLDGAPLGTFTPHSSPAGMVWLGASWPESVRSSFLVGRHGNAITGADGADTGFDVLRVQLTRQPDGTWTARTTSFLTGLGRPIDLHVTGDGSIFILEYTRTNDRRRAQLPGRILRLSVKPNNR